MDTIEELEMDMLSEHSRRQLIRFPPSHYTSPLTYYPQRHAVDIYLGNREKGVSVLLDSYADAISQICEKIVGITCVTSEPHSVYHHYYSECLRDGNDGGLPRSAQLELSSSITVAVRELADDIKYIRQSHPGLSNLMQTRDKLTGLDIEQLVASLSRVKAAHYHLEQARSKIQEMHISQNSSLCQILDSSQVVMYSVGEMIYVWLRKRPTELVLISYQQLLMVFDTVSSRFLCRMSVSINDLTKSDNLPSWGLLRKVYKWGDDLIKDYLMSAYSVLGEFESVVTAALITFPGADELGLGKEYMNATLKTAEENEEENGVPATCTHQILDILHNVDSPNILSELFGLRKHWGIPMVNAEESGKSVQEKIGEVMPLEGSAILRLQASVVRMIVQEFISQHGSWPAGVFQTEDRSLPIVAAFDSGRCRNLETDENHKHEHWALFKFLPNCTLDAFFNDLSLITDKSISVYREHLDAVYVRSLSNVKPPVVEENRRLILEYLRRQHLSVMDIFKTVMAGSCPSSWMANSASMKGTEMKHQRARIFAVFTYEIRQYFAATEEVIKDAIFRYNPHQTMTMSETDLLQKLRSISLSLDPSSDSRYLNVMHIIDFSRWNLRMRYANTAAVFKIIDDFIGCPGLIESSHLLFQDMINLVQDPFNPPSLGVLASEIFTIWKNHEPGWEGQRQKGWTLATSAALAILTYLTGVRSVICGQGDNQTILAQFPIPDQYRNSKEWIIAEPAIVKQCVDDYYSVLVKECTAIGLKIKTAETCRGLHFFNYGKRLFMNGIELSMMLKKMAKNMIEPNDFYPTSEAILKTLQGSSFSAGIVGHPSILPYLMYRILLVSQVYSSFQRNQLIQQQMCESMNRRNIFVDDKFIGILLKLPPSLGGVPQTNLAGYLFRGHPDPLCIDTVMLKLRAQHGCQTSLRIMKIAETGKWFSMKSIAYESLIQAPFSLNLNIPFSASKPLTDEIGPAVGRYCRNPMITDMFSDNVVSAGKLLIADLIKIRPFQPLVANDIFSRSIPGKRQIFLQGMTNTTSLGRLVYENRKRPMVYKIMELEFNQLEHWVNRVIDIVDYGHVVERNLPSHHNYAQLLRNLSWGMEISGITVPHPLEQFVIVSAPHDICTHTCQKFQREHILMVQHSENLRFLPGGDKQWATLQRSFTGDPYLGSILSEGLVHKRVLCLNPDDSWRDIIRLNTVKVWISEHNSSLQRLIDQIIRSRTNVNSQIIDLSTGIPSRLSYNHRAALLSAIHKCGVSTTTNMHSRLYISSDRMGKYSHGEFNYHLPYGPAYLCLQSLLCLSGAASNNPWNSNLRSIFHCHVRSDDVPPVYDGKLKIADQISHSQFLLQSPKIIYADACRLMFDHEEGPQSAVIWVGKMEATLRESRFGYASQLVSAIVYKEAALHDDKGKLPLFSQDVNTTSLSIGDVSSIGVKTLLQTIAWEIILHCSLHLLTGRSLAATSFIAMDLLDQFSPAFWGYFVSPISSRRNLEIVSRSYPDILHRFGILNTLQAVPLMKMILCEEISFILKKMLQSCNTPGSYSFFPISASSARSCQYLFAKYLSLITCLSLSSVGIEEQKTRVLAKKINHLILSAPTENLQSVIRQGRLILYDIAYNNDCRWLYIPKCTFMSKTESWVDRLRSEPTPIIEGNIHTPYRSWPKIYPQYASDLIITYPIQAIITETENCKCVPFEGTPSYPMEMLYIRTGVPDKSGIHLMDVLFSLGLKYTFIVCYGSRSGSEAFSLASLDQCLSVYVGISSDISEFPQHMIGSFIPSCFIGRIQEEKLWTPASSIVVNIPVYEDKFVEMISSHISQSFDSCFVDLTIHCPRDHSTIFKGLVNLCKVSVKMPKMNWLVIKVSYSCPHFVNVILTYLGQVFRNLCPLSGNFSGGRVSGIYIAAWGKQRHGGLGLNPHKPNSSLWLSHHPSTTYVHKRVFSFARSHVVKTNGRERNQILQSLRFGRPSLSFAIGELIPGLVIIDETGFSRLKLRDGLEDVQNVLVRLIETQKPGVRRDDSTRRNIKLFRSLLLVNLLLRLTVSEILSVSAVIDEFGQMVENEHTHDTSEGHLTVSFDHSIFINEQIPHILEILGHTYGHRIILPKLNLFRCDVHVSSENLSEGLSTGSLIFGLERIGQPEAVDLKWRWFRRSRILFVLMAHVLIPNHPILLSTIATRWIRHIESHTVFTRLLSHTTSSDCNTFDYTVHGESLPLDMPISPIIVLCKVSTLPFIIERYGRGEVFKCPWTGTIPEECIYLSKSVCETDSNAGCIYPSFNKLLSYIHNEGDEFLGCRCWDCSTEHYLCRKLCVTHAEIDSWSSLSKKENVFSLSHVL